MQRRQPTRVARVARAHEHVAAVCVRRPLLLAIRSTAVRPADDSVSRDNLLPDAVRDGDGTDGVLDLDRRRVCPEPDDSREPGRDGLASLLDDSSSYDLREAECEPWALRKNGRRPINTHLHLDGPYRSEGDGAIGPAQEDDGG